LDLRDVWYDTDVRVKVLFFGQLKDIVRRSEDTFEAAGPACISTVFERYAAEFPVLSQLRSSILFARNQSFSEPGAAVADGDEIAFLPPVSGGSTPYTHEVEHPSGHFFALTRRPIETGVITQRLQRPEDGAVVAFEGIVRNNTKGRATRFLDYECYEPMAIKVMTEIGLAIAGAHAISRIGMVHRLGRMEVGEASVVIVTTAPHRKPAFDAALEGINRLKKTVPIWKKEHFEDGEVWVEGEWDESLTTPS
jgi:molybdopterin synthase catalytic subunit/molybdopterin converting factor small subunit